MSFEQGFKSDSGCVSSPSMIHEAMDHVKTTWSNVLHGKASTTEYLEAAAEVIVVAAGAIALKQGGKMFSSRVNVVEDIVAKQVKQYSQSMRETERIVVSDLRAAAKANVEYLKTVKRTPDGAIIFDGFSLTERTLPFYRPVANPMSLSNDSISTLQQVRAAAKGDVWSAGLKKGSPAEDLKGFIPPSKNNSQSADALVRRAGPSAGAGLAEYARKITPSAAHQAAEMAKLMGLG